MTTDKKKRSALYYLQDILVSIGKVQKYALKGKERFFEDDLTQDGVIRRIEIIGEASNRIPKEITDNYPEIPWRQIVGFRNIAIHEYFRIDLNIIWALIESGELEKLQSVANQIIADISSTLE